jgi:acetyltransferase-like isoleucine patch superfamily enzyme
MVKKILAALLFKLYAIRKRRLRNLILCYVQKLEGGQIHSKSLRRIFADYHNIEIGMYSYGGCFNSQRIGEYTKIGRYCSFAEEVYIFNRNHPIRFKSMHPFFFNPACGYIDEEKIPINRIVVGNDVWVGQNAIILPNVKKVGDGAVIGAGAVVTKDVPDFAVVVGNPAEVIKYRFHEKTIAKIRTSEWWNKDIEELREDFEEFLRPVEEENRNEV